MPSIPWVIERMANSQDQRNRADFMAVFPEADGIDFNSKA
jgi:hypothetical protein